MLQAPSSFRRFMEATKKAKEQQAKRDKQHRKSQGLDVSDDEEEETPQQQQKEQLKQKHADAAAAAGSKGDGAGEKPDKTSAEGNGSGDDDDDDKPGGTWLRPDLGNGSDDEEEEDNKKGKKGKKGANSGGGKQGDDEDGGKRKYQSLRERKSEARKMAKAAKDEGDVFMYGEGFERQEKSGRVDPSFGETADAPPSITLKRKSGGKGAKSVPVVESGHKIAGHKGAGNRQSQIFKNLMRTAQAGKGAGASKSRGAGGKNATAAGAGIGGLRRAAELKALREQVIAGYREMRGRPTNNGRSAALGADPSRLFSATAGPGAATIRRDAGKKSFERLDGSTSRG
jgi:hypothetical protein